MSNISNIGKSGYINPHKDEVNHLVNKHGDKLFSGYEITWTAIGDSSWERIKNYCRSIINEDFANAVRDAFWDYMTAEVEKLTSHSGIEALERDLSKSDLSSAEKVRAKLENIKLIPSSDMSEGKKNELVLLIINNYRAANPMTDNSIANNDGLELPRETAIHYFKTAKEKCMKDADGMQKKILGDVGGKEIRNMLHERFSNREIKKEQDLENFRQDYKKAMQIAIVERLGGDVSKWDMLDQETRQMFLEHFKADMSDLVRGREDIESAGLEMLSEELGDIMKKFMLIPETDVPRVKKMEMILSTVKSDPVFSQIPEVKVARDYFQKEKENIMEFIYERMPQSSTYYLGNIQALSNLEDQVISSEQELKNFQKEYIAAMINEGVKKCNEDPVQLRKMEKEVGEFLNKTALSKTEKDALLGPIREPRMKIEIMNAVDEMAMKSWGSQMNKQKISDVLQAIKERSAERLSTGDLEKFQEIYLTEVIKAMVDQYDNNPSMLAILEKNTIRLLNSAISLSKEKKEMLIAQIQNPRNQITIMNGIDKLAEDLSSEDKARLVKQSEGSPEKYATMVVEALLRKYHDDPKRIYQIEQDLSKIFKEDTTNVISKNKKEDLLIRTRGPKMQLRIMNSIDLMPVNERLKMAIKDIRQQFEVRKIVIKNEDDLRAFRLQYTEAVIEAVIKHCNGDLSKLEELMQNVNTLVDKDIAIDFLPDEKAQLIGLVTNEIEEARSMNIMDAVDKMAKATLKNEEALRRIENLRENFRGSPGEYAEEMIKVLINLCEGDQKKLNQLKNNVRELLTYDTAITFSDEKKRELIDLIKIS